MSLKLSAVTSFVLAGVTVANAATPVARVISNEPLRVNGISVPARNFTPLQLGGGISTEATSALIQFTDGSSIVLQPHSEMTVAGKPGNVQVMIVRGAARYNLAASSRVHVTDLNSKVSSHGSDFEALGSGSLSAATLASLTAPAHSVPGLADAPIAGAPIASGPSEGFVAAGSLTGSLETHAGTNGATATRIVTPSGLILNLTPTVSSTGKTTYTISSITTTVTQPNGVSTTVQVTSGSLIGATITPVNNSNAATTVFNVTPVGSTTPLTPSQAATAVNTSVTTTIQTAVANGQLPAGTTADTVNVVRTGNFSTTGS